MQLTMFENVPDNPAPSSSGKTCRESSRTTQTPSDVFLARLLGKAVHCSRQGANGRTLVVCMDPNAQSLGGFLMPNISEWPNDVAECSLSQALEKGSTPERYYLTSRTCAGILRRLQAKGQEPKFYSAVAAVLFRSALECSNVQNVDESSRSSAPRGGPVPA